MRLASLQCLLLGASAVLASPAEHEAAVDSATLAYEAASLVSAYVPPSVYTQLTASVAAAAAAASVTGDPGSLFLSALLATTPPPWFHSAVPPYFSSNIDALEAAVSGLHGTTAPTASSSQTTGVTGTTNSLGSSVPASSTSKTLSSSTNAAIPTACVQNHAGLGAAALAAGLAAFL